MLKLFICITTVQHPETATLADGGIPIWENSTVALNIKDKETEALVARSLH